MSLQAQLDGKGLGSWNTVFCLGQGLVSMQTPRVSGRAEESWILGLGNWVVGCLVALQAQIGTKGQFKGKRELKTWLGPWCRIPWW